MEVATDMAIKILKTLLADAVLLTTQVHWKLQLLHPETTQPVLAITTTTQEVTITLAPESTTTHPEAIRIPARHEITTILEQEITTTRLEAIRMPARREITTTRGQEITTTRPEIPIALQEPTPHNNPLELIASLHARMVAEIMVAAVAMAVEVAHLVVAVEVVADN